MSKINFVQFRPDGKVRVYVNKRPPVNLGPVIEETPDIKKKMAGIPYSRWELKDGVLSAKESSIKLHATLLREVEPLPEKPSEHISMPLLLPGEKQGMTLETAMLFAAAAVSGAGITYVLLYLL